MTTYAEGEVHELVGRPRLLGDAIIAPLTGEPCVAHRSRGRVFTALDVMGELVSEPEVVEVAPFAIETPHGEVRIVDRPRLHLHLHTLGYVDLGRRIAFLTPWRLAQHARTTLFEHAVVRVDDVVRVMGVVTRATATGSELGFRDVAVETRLTGYGSYPLTLMLER